MLSTSYQAQNLDWSAATLRSNNLKHINREASAPREPVCEGQMPISNGNSRRRVSGDSRNSSSLRDAKRDNQDWLAAQAAKHPVAALVDHTSMTERAVHNIRQRKSKISFDNLVEWCRNDPSFAAAFASYVGLIKPGEAEFAGALTQAFNAYQRRQVGAAE